MLECKWLLRQFNGIAIPMKRKQNTLDFQTRISYYSHLRFRNPILAKDWDSCLFLEFMQ